MTISTITFLGLIFGILGTSIGGIIGTIIRTNSNKFISFILEFSAGLMTAVICFNLIPESIAYTDISICLFGITTGVLLMITCDFFIKKLEIKNTKLANHNNHLLKSSLIIFAGLTIHNFPERISNWNRI